MIDGIALFSLIGRKLDYIATRHTLLAQNVAHADTPGFMARDLKPFSAVLDMKGVAPLARTDDAHMGPVRGKTEYAEDRRAGAWEVEPSGNGVALEEQMMKAADATRDYQLATSLMRKNVSMLRAQLTTR